MKAGLAMAGVHAGAGALADEHGQAVVEAVIVLPAMVFLILCILQLTMLQHARIMTDYAAYCAARAGIVFNGDPVAMRRAAEIALSPTMGRTDNMPNFLTTVNGGVGGSNLPAEVAQAQSFNLPGVVIVQTLPPPGSAGAFTSLASQTGGNEIDFDDIRQAADQWNILQIRVRYFYRMSVPFANEMLQAIYFASVASRNLLVGGEGGGWKGFDWTYSKDTPFYQNAAGVYSGSGGGYSNGMQVVPESARISTAAAAHTYYFPINATYSMRMQSNLYQSNAP